jgi:threonine dehydrogenase-like Zn-dependent dehydrogenase
MSAAVEIEYAYHSQCKTQPGDFSMSIALVSQGKIDLKPIVTHRYDRSLNLPTNQTLFMNIHFPGTHSKMLVKHLRPLGLERARMERASSRR